jgi:hypothetical protein
MSAVRRVVRKVVRRADLWVQLRGWTSAARRAALRAGL